ncbi:hypothetical protein OJAV_G00118460 [Oryzias javanicus]|uniref:t-SNARE coiled-coil homology domain-containing protein n=1 Tax=Oryzias javanicus TaxID=123683 RepID=A0A3S2MRV9_ORYJA|nr:hypothetical protein OJAV_G00118460 [Oryzias javanicus]
MFVRERYHVLMKKNTKTNSHLGMQPTRSHPSILKVPNDMFYNGELQPCACPSQLYKQGFPVVFHGVAGISQQDIGFPSLYNRAEIKVIKDYLKSLINHLHQKNVNHIQPGEIGIISPYRKQVDKIQMAIQSDADLSKENLENVEVGTVDKFQGKEFSAILMSTVRAFPRLLDKPHFSLGFVKDERRFNVALTRARSLLIVVGDPRLLVTDKSWNKFIHYCLKEGAYRGFPLFNMTEDTPTPADTQALRGGTLPSRTGSRVRARACSHTQVCSMTSPNNRRAHGRWRSEAPRRSIKDGCDTLGRVRGQDGGLVQNGGDVRSLIEKISSQVEKIETVHGTILSSTNQDKRLRDELELLNDETKKDACVVRTKLKSMQRSWLKKETGASVSHRIYENQHSHLTRCFAEVMRRHHRAQICFRDKCKAQIQRQLQIVDKVTSNEELEEMLHRSSLTLFISDVNSETGVSGQALNQIESRHQDILSLESSITELHEIFADTAMLLESQGELINNIERNVMSAAQYVDESKEETDKAITYKKNRHKVVSLPSFFRPFKKRNSTKTRPEPNPSDLNHNWTSELEGSNQD